MLAHVQGVTMDAEGKPAEGVQRHHARWSRAMVTHTPGGPGRGRIASYLEASKLSYEPTV